MPGLSASYIANKLAAEGLDFLNSAATAGAIAGTEPVEGPVFDDIEKGLGDQFRDYDIRLAVAQKGNQ